MTFLALNTNKDISLLSALDIQTDPASSEDDRLLPLKYVRRHYTFELRRFTNGSPVLICLLHSTTVCF